MSEDQLHTHHADLTAHPEDAVEILAALRWKADQLVVNHEGDRVWLKSMPPLPSMTHGYITDCCFVEVPCERHAQFVHYLAEAPKKLRYPGGKDGMYQGTCHCGDSFGVTNTAAEAINRVQEHADAKNPRLEES